MRIGMGLFLTPTSARPVPTSAPVNTGAPTITGALTQGQTLTANPGSWTGLPTAAFTYQWQRSGVNIAGATNATYVAQAADVSAGASAITVEVTATNVVGPTTAESAGVTIAAPLTITGSPAAATVGNAYTFTPGGGGGRPPYTHALTGTLPSGLSFNPATGAITGTPSSSGTASGLNVTRTDADGLTASLGTFSIVVGGATSSAITLSRDWFVWGASSGRGGQGLTGETIWHRLSHQIDATTVDGTEVASGGAQPLHTVSNGRKIHNRAVSGDGYAAILSKVTTQAADPQPGDVRIYHAGDNTITPGTAGMDQTLVNTLVSMNGLTDGDHNPRVFCVNTRGGWNGSSVSEPPGSYSPTMKELIFRKLSALYPGEVIDFFWELQNNANAYGLQDLTNDQADIDKGYSPRGFMQLSGAIGSHNDDHGYRVEADYGFQPIADAIEGGTKWPLRQYITPVRPASPAAGDVMGTPKFYGAGGTCSLASSNSQTDHAVASSGQITRIGSALQTRDLDFVHMQMDKSGRPSRVQKHIMVGELARAAHNGMVEFDGYSHIAKMASSATSAGTVLLVCRLHRAPGTDGTQQSLWPGAFLRTGNTIDFGLYADSGPTVGSSLLNMTSTGLFTVANPVRWLVAALDIPNGIVKAGTFVTPAPGSYVPITNNGAATTRLQASTTQTVGLSSWAFANQAAGLSGGQLGTKLGNFQINDMWVGVAYRDIATQAVRELFVDSSGNPNPAVFSADGVVDGITPLHYFRGTATDWRVCNAKGSAAGDYGFHSWKNPTTGEYGYLKNV